MVTLNEVLVEPRVYLYEVREQWYSIKHDYPYMGNAEECNHFDKQRGIYSSREKADQDKDKFYTEVREKMSKLDEFDQLREAVKRGIPRHADDFSYRVVVTEHVVPRKDIEQKDGEVFWKTSKESIIIK